jgi:hypothetical protein
MNIAPTDTAVGGVRRPTPNMGVNLTLWPVS